MFRKDLLRLLQHNPLSISEIAAMTDEDPKLLEDDIHHLIKSLKHLEYRLHVFPASCKRCGFKFNKDKLHKPGRCPLCKSTWITETRIGIE